MPIILSHNSALERLRAVPPIFDTARPINQPVDLRSLKLSRTETPSLSMSRLGVMQEPIHCLTHIGVPRTRVHRFIQHRTSAGQLPAGLLRQISPDLFISGPELVFLQMASTTSMLGLIVLGFELCGLYSHFAPFASGFYERKPLTTTDLISNALDRLSGHRGIKAARAALGFVLNGSASPMETVFACMLALPSSMGGEGLTVPRLNYEVQLDEVGKKRAGTETCRVDIAWPELRIGLEYNGGPYHTDEQKDRFRREALAHEKWTIFTADIDDMANHEKYTELLALIKDDVPRRKGMSSPDGAASKQLFKRLMVATRAGVGLNRALFSVTVPRGSVKIHV